MTMRVSLTVLLLLVACHTPTAGLARLRADSTYCGAGHPLVGERLSDEQHRQARQDVFAGYVSCMYTRNADVVDREVCRCKAVCTAVDDPTGDATCEGRPCSEWRPACVPTGSATPAVQQEAAADGALTPTRRSTSSGACSSSARDCFTPDEQPISPSIVVSAAKGERPPLTRQEPSNEPSATTPLIRETHAHEAYRVAFLAGFRGTSHFVLVTRDEHGACRLSYRAFEEGGQEYLPSQATDRELSGDECGRILAIVEASGFWRGARLESEAGALDGVLVELEGKKGLELRATSAPNPLSGPMMDLARALRDVATK